MTSNWHIGILIPAHNEEKLLPRCLHSVLAACDQLPKNYTFDIVLAVDSSSDKTFQIGKEMIGNQGIVLNINENNVGGARKVAANFFLQRYEGSFHQCWLANTDADCSVPLNWLTTQLKWAKLDFQGVAGMVTVDSFIEHDSSIKSKFLKSYLVYADKTHPHVHGANLGIRADAYQRIGGWNALKTGEDHDLWDRLSLHDIPKFSDSKLLVLTSGRKIGRAPEGFANRLASFKEEK